LPFGVPLSFPVEVLNIAQDGLFDILNVSLSWFVSLVFGVKLYAWSSSIVVVGVPLMVGGVFDWVNIVVVFLSLKLVNVLVKVSVVLFAIFVLASFIKDLKPFCKLSRLLVSEIAYTFDLISFA